MRYGAGGRGNCVSRAKGRRTCCSDFHHRLTGVRWRASSPPRRWPGCSYRRRPRPRPSQNACERRNNNQYDKLLECVTLAGVREHQAAFQAIADANGGTRADQTPGLRGERRLRRSDDAGGGLGRRASCRSPTRWASPSCEQLTPVQATYATGGFTGTALGDVDGRRGPGRHQPDAAAGQHERLRRRVHRGRRRRPARRRPGRPGRLRRLPCRCDRPHPARRVQLRPEGLQRRGRRRQRRDHLQPGQHARPRGRSSSAPPSRPTGSAVGALDDPRRRRLVRRRRSARPARVDRPHLRAARGPDRPRT